MKLNKFKIITPSFNNKDYIEYNLASVLNQTYTNYEWLYIDDCSPDGTGDIVENILKDNKNCKVIKNSTNRGAMANYFDHLHQFVDDSDIVIHLDGDDWLYDENVLENLNNFYNKHECWMTYGKFICFDGTNPPEFPNPQNSEYPTFVKENNLYRKDHWRPSHMRTYRGFLIKSISKDDLVSKIDNKQYWHAADLAMQYPCIEMAGPHRVGVLDFISYVYNTSPKNNIRTKEREHVDNSKYEVEIRNKKHYRFDSLGEKLPQVNVIGDYRERNSIPKNFSYVYNITDGDFDVTLLQDSQINNYIDGKIKISHGKIIADIHEPKYLFEQKSVHLAVLSNYSMFDRILTYDKELLKLPNAVFRNGGYECVLNKNVHSLEYPTLCDEGLYKIYTDKDKLVSCISSNKSFSTGHVERMKIVSHLHSNSDKVDIYGVGIREIKGKIEALKDYMFSVCIENGVADNYFTEKILDCFLTGTVPIYKGCPNVSDFFDVSGIITFDTKEELIEIINSLTPDKYSDMLPAINKNFETAKGFAMNNDQFFQKYIKDLI